MRATYATCKWLIPFVPPDAPQVETYATVGDVMMLEMLAAIARKDYEDRRRRQV